MPPSAAVPKPLWGPPARDPPPTWMISSSRRSPPHASIHYRGFSGEFEFSVPNDDVSAITHRIIQGEQALQMYHCQIQSFQCQMGLLQTQAQLHQLQLMSQRIHDTDIQQSALPDWAVSEPQNRVDNRRRSRSRPPLTDDHRSTGRVEGPARRPGRIEGSSHPPASERSGPTIPSHGLFYHSCSPSCPLIETNVLQQFPAVSQMTTVLGRPSKVHTVIEYQYHLGSGAQLWTLPSLVVFRCPLLTPDLTQIDWFTLYSYDMIRLRRRVSLLQDSSRIQNAFELHRIMEQQQGWVPKLEHYSRLPGYLTPEESKRHCQSFLDFLTHDISRGHGTIFDQHEVYIRAAIRVMAETIFIRPDNYSLIATIDLFTDDRHDMPLAIVPKLQPVIFEQRPQPQIAQHIIFGHNTNAWTAASCIEEGLMRPSAVDPADPSWLAAVGFYARGVVGVRNVTDRSLTDVLVRAQKYVNYRSARPLSDRIDSRSSDACHYSSRRRGF